MRKSNVSYNCMTIIDNCFLAFLKYQEKYINFEYEIHISLDNSEFIYTVNKLTLQSGYSLASYSICLYCLNILCSKSLAVFFFIDRKKIFVLQSDTKFFKNTKNYYYY